MTVTKAVFGTLPDGRTSHIFTMANSHGRTVELTDMGAAVRSITVPDRDGTPTDVVLCHGAFEDSIANDGYFGATCGRSANRIAGSEFTLNGQIYKLASNFPDFQLHGGIETFANALWNSELTDNGVIFTHRSPDGDQGFPGALDVTVTYSWADWGDGSRLRIDYNAVSDADTVVNLTNHSYFNLNGQGNGGILSHSAMLDCDEFTPVKPNVCVTGGIRAVSGTDMDFTAPRTFGERINSGDEQLRYAGGYDFNYIIRGGGFRRCARVVGDKSGIVLEVYTDKPGVHLYTGGNIGEVNGKNGAKYRKYDGFCLETQFYPDAINQPSFPSPILRKGEVYRFRTDFLFSSARA